MTGGRIVRSILMSAAVVLGVAGCPPEPPAGNDAGAGGTATGGTTVMGGRATGGTASGGGASTCIGTTVATLPALGSCCGNLSTCPGTLAMGTSLCDADGNQCVCRRGTWYCNTSCASTYPTEPAPNSACIHGAACNYPSGVSCACVYDSWSCMGGSGCPATAPLTGEACNGLNGLACDYPHEPAPVPHLTCLCISNADASTGSTWTCAVSDCPATQPPYSPADSCSRTFAFCSYGSAQCTCWMDDPWICGLYVWASPPPHDL
jgi:hypothetical protein